MDFRILGPLEVHDGGRTVAIGQGNQRALLALLVLRAGEVVSSDTLIDELWDEHPPATAAKSLQVYVSRLRKALGDGVIVTRHPGYVLDLEPEQIDVHRFEQLVASARDQPVAEAAATLRDALGLWRGQALADVGAQPSVRSEGSRLEELRVAAIEDRIEADLALGRQFQLVAELETLVQQHPYRERLRRQLMLALYRSGRQADALAAYRDARATLANELGLEPSPELRELEQRILAQDPALVVAAELRAADAPKRRRRTAVLAAVAGVLAAAAVVGILVARGGDASAVVAQSNSVAVIDAGSNRVTDAIPLGERPTEIAARGNDIWVLHPDRSTIAHLDRASRDARGTVGVGGAPSDLAAVPRGVWVSDAVTASARLIGRERLIPARTVVTRTSPVVAGPYASVGQLAVGFGSLWLGSGDDVVTRIDLRTGRVAGRILRVVNGAMAAGTGSIWVAGPLQESPVTRIDPRRNAAVARMPLHKFRASGIAVGGGVIWVTDIGSDHVWMIDPARTSPSGSVRVGAGPIDVAYGAGSIWVANSGDGTVSRIDPVTGTVVETISVGGSPTGLAVSGNEVWVTVA